MMDLLPFLRVTGDTPEKQIAEIAEYLMQFKETLEFALTNISKDNLSPELVAKLNDLGANIEKTYSEKENEIAQLAKNNILTVSDVTGIVKGEVGKIKFSVNMENGNLEYTL